MNKKGQEGKEEYDRKIDDRKKGRWEEGRVRLSR
jgi:hypothetical protein